jgi:hypothetical protein
MRARVAVVALTCAAATAACGSTAPAPAPSGTTTSRGAVATTAAPPAMTTSAAPSPTPSTQPSLAGAISGQPDFTFSVPGGWTVLQEDAHQVTLGQNVGGAVVAEIRMSLDPALEQTAGMRTTAVDGSPAYIASAGDGNGGNFQRDVLVRRAHAFYEILCTPYSGSTPGAVTASCSAFTASVRFSGG